jgi:hypothetical protein
MLAKSSKARALVIEALVMYLKAFVVIVAVIVLAFAYLLIMYGWAKTMDAMSRDDIKKLVIGAFAVPVAVVAAHLIGKSLDYVFRRKD